MSQKSQMEVKLLGSIHLQAGAQLDVVDAKGTPVCQLYAVAEHREGVEESVVYLHVRPLGFVCHRGPELELLLDGIGS